MITLKRKTKRRKKRKRRRKRAMARGKATAGRTGKLESVSSGGTSSASGK